MVPIRKGRAVPRLAFSGLLAASLLAVTAGPSAAAVVYGDQVDRGDGISGAARWSSGVDGGSPYIDPAEQPTQGVAISDDGRYAWITSPTSDTTRALFRRDIAADTLKLMADDVTATGATATPSGRISVLTKRGLVAADQNGTPDLYLLDAFTGAPTLASVDASGAAIGGIDRGFVSRDGSAVVLSKGGATYRRLLSGGAPTELGAGVPGTSLVVAGGQYRFQPPADLSGAVASADGRTVALTDRKVLTPAGMVDVKALLPSTFATYDDFGVPAFITADGAKAIVRGEDQGVRAVAVVDLATKQVRIVRPTGLPSTATFGTVQALGPVAGKVIVDVSLSNNTTWVGLFDLTTGAITKVSGEYQDRVPTTYSFNGRYGLANSRAWMYAVPTVANATLPGGPGSAPATYVSYNQGCQKPVFIEPYNGRPTVSLTRPPLAPPSVQSMQVAARNLSNGVVMNQFTLTPGVVSTLPINGYYGDVRLEVALRYTSGLLGRNLLAVPGHEPYLCYGNFGL